MKKTARALNMGHTMNWPNFIWSYKNVYFTFCDTNELWRVWGFGKYKSDTGKAITSKQGIWLHKDFEESQKIIDKLLKKI